MLGIYVIMFGTGPFLVALNSINYLFLRLRRLFEGRIFRVLRLNKFLQRISLLEKARNSSDDSLFSSRIEKIELLSIFGGILSEAQIQKANLLANYVSLAR